MGVDLVEGDVVVLAAPSPWHRLLRSPKIAGGLAAVSAAVGGGVSYAHQAAARQAADLRLRTSGAALGVTVTVTASLNPFPARPPLPRVTPTVTATVHPARSPVPPKAAPPPVLHDNTVGTDAGGLFSIFPGADILVPAPVSPSDPAQVTCTSSELMIAPGAEGTQTCHIAS